MRFWLGHPVKLDERCSLEARSPDLWQSCSQSFIYARPDRLSLSKSPAGIPLASLGDGDANRYSFSPLTFFHAFFMFSASSSMIGLSHRIRPAQPKSRSTSNNTFNFKSESFNAR